jgi:hypothetical protein
MATAIRCELECSTTRRAGEYLYPSKLSRIRPPLSQLRRFDGRISPCPTLRQRLLSCVLHRPKIFGDFLVVTGDSFLCFLRWWRRCLLREFHHGQPKTIAPYLFDQFPPAKLCAFLHVRVPDSVAERNEGAKLAKNLSAVVNRKLPR